MWTWMTHPGKIITHCKAKNCSNLSRFSFSSTALLQGTEISFETQHHGVRSCCGDKLTTHIHLIFPQPLLKYKGSLDITSYQMWVIGLEHGPDPRKAVKQIARKPDTEAWHLQQGEMPIKMQLHMAVWRLNVNDQKRWGCSPIIQKPCVGKGSFECCFSSGRTQYILRNIYTVLTVHSTVATSKV